MWVVVEKVEILGQYCAVPCAIDTTVLFTER